MTKSLLRFVPILLLGVSAYAQPASLAGFEDKASFDIYQQEQHLGVFKCNWERSGHFTSEGSISLAGQTVAFSLEITVDDQGRWTKLAAQTPLGPAVGTRDGDKLTRTFRDKSFTETVKPGAVLFDNYSPSLMSQAIRAYDQAKGGEQKLPLLVAPGVALELTLDRTGKVERVVNGTSLELTKYSYRIAGVEIIAYADSTGKLYLADVPAQHAYFVRSGYDSLHIEPVTDAKLSAPKYSVKVERGIQIPMRDGVKLVGDLYRPAELEGKLPIILVRTPYKKELTGEMQGNYFAKRGYIYVVQDTRGRFGSPGAWEPFMNEALDGYDTIEWLAKQPYSTGKIGMIGGSYLGWVQWQAASRKPPHLTCIIPNVAPPDPFYNIPYEHGAFFLLGSIWWADVVASNATGDISGAGLAKISDKKYTKALRTLPVIDLDKSVLGGENKFWREWISHPNNDDFWDRANHLDRLKDVNIPAFHQSGWFDGDGIGTKLNYERMIAHNASYQKVVIGPWGHSDQSSRFLGDRDFGASALRDLNTEYMRWFDHWLKGVDNGIESEPLASIFVMGTNKWLNGPRYPLPVTKFENWYFSSSTGANTSAGDGKLVRVEPAADARADKFRYDPGDPTPDPRHYEDTYEGKETRSAEALKKESEAYHDKVISSRKDILVYTTEPFKEPYTFAGPMSAVLYASSSAKDTDWFVALYEVNKEGKYFWLGKGVVRARYRNSTHKPEFLKPGEIYEYTLDLWQTGITIPRDSKLRVEVQSALFPSFSRNLNTGGHNETETEFVAADQVIYHDAKHPSHLVLPSIPADALK